MRIRKTPQQRATEFFNKSIIKKMGGMDYSDNKYNSLVEFWDTWLSQNSTEPTEHIYKVCYKLLKYHGDSINIYDMYMKLKKERPHTLNHFILLYGDIRGKELYANRNQKIKQTKYISAEEYVKNFLHNKQVIKKLGNTTITNNIFNELVLLATIKSYYFFSEDIDLICDFIIYFYPNFIERYNKIKNTSPYTLEYYRYRYADNYIEKYTQYKDMKSKQSITFDNTIKYWLKNGLSLLDATEKVSEVQKTRSSKRKNLISCRNIEYWTNKGFSLEDAENKISQIQTRDLDFFINKYGYDNGMYAYNNMINKRVEKWLLKPIEDKKIINKSKGRTYEQLVIEKGKEVADEIINRRLSSCSNSISNESKEFFIKLDNIMDNYYKNNSITGYKGNERWVVTNNKMYFLDYVIDNCIIEYNGSFWHGDSRLFKKDDFILGKSVSEIWNYDKLKVENLQKLGYNILVIWSLDVKEDIDREINKCKDFLYEHARISNTD